MNAQLAYVFACLNNQVKSQVTPELISYQQLPSKEVIKDINQSKKATIQDAKNPRKPKAPR